MHKNNLRSSGIRSVSSCRRTGPIDEQGCGLGFGLKMTQSGRLRFTSCVNIKGFIDHWRCWKSRGLHRGIDREFLEQPLSPRSPCHLIAPATAPAVRARRVGARGMTMRPASMARARRCLALIMKGANIIAASLAGSSRASEVPDVSGNKWREITA
jgi:hypothetical protein